MNIRRQIVPLVAVIASELATINERQRERYFNAVTFNKREKARMDAGEIEQRDLPEPEPPMQVVITQPDAMADQFIGMFESMLKAAENWDERDEGIESFPGLKTFRLDPNNPNAGLYGTPNRSVISGNEAMPGIPAAEPAATPSTNPRLSDAARAKLDENSNAASAAGASTATATAEATDTENGEGKPAKTMAEKAAEKASGTRRRAGNES